jgi:glycosyltransferase involved in cell wall biosynthesis
VLRALRDAIPRARLIVVDDGSTDDTSLRARPLADELLRHDENLGKGRALRVGIAAALGRDADVVVTIDADGQHDAADAPRLLQALDDADVVVGQRIRSSGMMPVTRRVTNALSSAAIALVSGQRLHDTQSGFRAIRRRVLTAVAPCGDRYEYETDFLVRALRQGFVVRNVPVHTRYGPPSHFRAVRDSILIVQTIWRHRGTISVRPAT